MDTAKGARKVKYFFHSSSVQKKFIVAIKTPVKTGVVQKGEMMTLSDCLFSCSSIFRTFLL